MKKRLRKKLHKGEFQELGFSVSFNIKHDTVEEGMDTFDDFINAVEDMNMYVGGLYDTDKAKASMFVVSKECRSVTDEERLKVIEWLKADSRFEREYGGIGIGLSVVKDLLDTMQGTITIDSSEGAGTIVKLRMPFGIPSQN